MSHQHRFKHFIVTMMLCITQLMQPSLTPKKNDQNFDDTCLHKGIEVVSNASKDTYFTRQLHRNRAKQHPGYAAGLQTAGYLAIIQEQEIVTTSETVVPVQKSIFHLRKLWLHEGIEVLISQKQNLTVDEASVLRQQYKIQAINDHNFATQTRKKGFFALKPEHDRKENAKSAQALLQQHAQLRELITNASLTEMNILTQQAQRELKTIVTAQLIRSAQAATDLHNTYTIQISRSPSFLVEQHGQSLSRTVSWISTKSNSFNMQ